MTIRTIIAATLLTAATPAAATITHIEWRGYVTAGTDSGVFLPGGGGLTGLPWTFAVTIDDSVATPFNYAIPGTLSAIYGGSDEGAPSPVTAVLTVAGHSAAPLGNYFGSETSQIDYDPGFDNGHYSLIETDARSIDVAGNVSQFQVYRVDTLDPASIPWDYHTPLAYRLGPDLDRGDEARGGTAELFATAPDGTVDHAFAYMTATSVTVSGVPEPAGWALLAAGFGVAGGAARVSRSCRPRRTSRSARSVRRG